MKKAIPPRPLVCVCEDSLGQNRSFRKHVVSGNQKQPMWQDATLVNWNASPEYR